MSDFKPGIDYVGVTTAFLCHGGNGKFLMLRRGKNCRDEQGTWEFGGGRLEFGKTLEENVLQEVEEEYGCHGQIEEQLPAISLLRWHENVKTHWATIPFVIKVNPQEVKMNEPHKFDEMGWYGLDELPQPLHSGVSIYLDKVRDYLKKYEIS